MEGTSKAKAEQAKNVPPEIEQDLRDKGWVPIDEIGPGTPYRDHNVHPGWVHPIGSDGTKTFPDAIW